MRTIEYTGYQPRGLSRELTAVATTAEGKPTVFSGPTAFEVPEEITIHIKPSEDRCTFLFSYVDAEEPLPNQLKVGESLSLVLGAFTRKILELTFNNASQSLRSLELPKDLPELVTAGQSRQVTTAFMHNFMIVNAILSQMPNSFRRELLDALLTADNSNLK